MICKTTILEEHHGEEIIVDNERADTLVSRGYATYLEDIVEKNVVVERAIEDEDENPIVEKAVKKTVAKKPKTIKVNAKK